jgi:hypothetical protein
LVLFEGEFDSWAHLVKNKFLEKFFFYGINLFLWSPFSGSDVEEDSSGWTIANFMIKIYFDRHFWGVREW